MAKILTGKTSHPGVAQGEVLLLTEPVSFWGGVDHHGEIIDVHHAQHKAKMTNKICQPEKSNRPLASQSMVASNTAESMNNMQSLSK